MLCFVSEPGGGAGELPEKGLPTGGQETSFKKKKKSFDFQQRGTIPNSAGYLALSIYLLTRVLMRPSPLSTREVGLFR